MIGAFKLNLIAKGATVTAIAERITKTITPAGNARIAIEQGVMGSSAYFDGTGDQLSVASHTDFAYGSGDFTIEFWGYYTSIASGECFFDQRSTDPQVVPTLYYLNGTNLAYYVNGSNLITGSAVSLNTWHHIAVSRASGTTRLFLDGVLQGSAVSDSNSYVQGGPLIINGRYALDYSPAGYVDEFRVSNSARYTANFTPSVVPFANDVNTLFLSHFDGYDASTAFADSPATRTTKTVTANGNAQVSTAQSKFSGASALFDGTGDYLRSPYNTDYAFMDKDFTIECWFYATSFATTLRILCGNASANNGWRISIGAATSYWVYSGTAAYSTNMTVNLNTWYHFAAVKKGSVITFYLNGTPYTLSGFVARTTNTTSDLYIGIDEYQTGSQFWLGNIDEFRVSNCARYTAAFTPSITPFRSDDNTLLLLHMDGANASTTFTDDVAFSATSTNLSRYFSPITNSGVTLDTATKKFGTSSAKFVGGTGIQTTVTYSAVTTTGDWTIEGWYNLGTGFTSLNGSISLGGIGVGGGGGAYLRGFGGNGLVIEYWFTNGTQTINWNGNANGASGVIAANTWYHWAVVKSGGTFYIFGNGTQTSSRGGYSTSWPMFGTAQTLNNVSIGGPGNAMNNGFMDCIRYSKSARYTVTFTPSTTAFANDANTLLLLNFDGVNGSTSLNDDNGV